MDPVEEIKDRLPIEDLVGRYVDLKRSGSGYKGLCPFHGEKTPSFHVSPSRNSFHCFGCGKGGDAFTFIMELEHLAFPDALKRLADMSGVQLPERQTSQPSLKGKLHEANAAAAELFANHLQSSDGERARRYLAGRGFGAESIGLFQLGFAPTGRDVLVNALHAAGFDDRILLAAGLVLQDNIGGQVRDRFRGRLMFPIRDAGGKIVGFGGRAMGDEQPKYLNSPQTEIFDKSGVLFGIHLAADAIRQARQAVLVEGYLDAVRAHLGGYAYTVASLGTAVTVKQLATLSRLTGTVTLALDPDPAGQAAAARTILSALAELTRSRGREPGAAAALDLRVAVLPDSRGDPDELIRDHADEWEKTLQSSMPAFDFYFTHTMAQLDRSSDGWRQEAIDRLMPAIRDFSDSPAWQVTWIERLAAEIGVDAVLLQHSLPTARSGPRKNTRRARDDSPNPSGPVASAVSRNATTNPEVTIEESLLAVLLQVLVIPNGAVSVLQDMELTRPEHRAIVEALLAWRESGNYDYEMFRETLTAEIAEVADALRGRSAPLPDPTRIDVQVRFHLERMRHFRVKAQMSEASQFLAELEPTDLPTARQELARLMSERSEIERSLETLSRLAIQARPAASQGTIDQDSGSW